MSQPTAAEPALAPLPRVERLAAWALRGPLAALVLLLCAVELITWAPNYLTWPWWADHDVFATAALCWDRGILPYRDLLGNNFPATTYLFWAVGKVRGWGDTPGFWAVDVGFLLGLSALWLAWSRRRLGSVLPAAVGLLTMLAYYLGLDYSQAAQRDWHAPLFAVMGLMIAQAWTGRAGRLASALAMATALAFRPQAVLLAPAFVVALDEAAWREEGRSWRRSLLAVLEWGAMVTIGVALWFAPLAVAGILDDFVRSVRMTAIGGSYNRVTPASFARAMLVQFLNVKIVLTAAALVLLPLGRVMAGPARRVAPAWMVALLGILLYRPLSPNPLHAYLTHPITLVWAASISVLCALWLESEISRPTLRLAAVLLVVGLGGASKPRFCNPNGSWEAIGFLRRGVDPGPSPTGYTTNPESRSAGRYEWADYRDLLDYLRHATKPNTRVANCLRFVPAITGPTARLPALPAESIAWLRVVRASDQPAFARALEEATDALVVWDPDDPTIKNFERLPLVDAAIRRHYEPSVRFGYLEVWRRRSKGAVASAGR